MSDDSDAPSMADCPWTPGPWRYRPQEHDDWGVVRPQPNAEGWAFPVAYARAGRLEEDGEREAHRLTGTDPWETNARLIAAAPDMAAYIRTRARAGDAEAAALWAAVAPGVSA